MPQTWVLLGFGEAASTLTLALRARRRAPRIVIALPTERTPSAATKARLSEAGVVYEADPAVVRTADVLISLVTPATAVQAAETVAHYLKRGAFFVDLNSVAGQTAEEVGRLASASGAIFVDGGVMGPFPLQGLRVPILLSGPGAQAFNRIARRAGFNTSVLSARPGDASRMKMLWSVVTKGTIALLAESLIAGHRLNLLTPLTDLLAREYGNTGTEAMVLRMLGSTVRSGRRRLDEMREAKATLAEAQVPAWTAEVTMQWIAALAALEASPGDSVAEVVAAISEALEPRLAESVHDRDRLNLH